MRPASKRFDIRRPDVRSWCAIPLEVRVSLMRDRLLLLRTLRSAGLVPVSALIALMVGRALLPAALAVTMALLVGRIEQDASAGLALAAFVATLLLSHLIDA